MGKATEKKTNGYGTRPLWQWILLYVVIGAVLYGGIYYFFFAQKGGYTSQTGQYNYPSTQQQTDVSKEDAAEEATITLTQKGWSPATLTVKAGQVVTWVNNSGQDATVNSDPHPTHTNYPPLNLGNFSDGQALSLDFPKAGTYGYHNHLDPSQTGTIIVQ